MNDSPEDRGLRQFGKVIVFLMVGLISSIFLAASLYFARDHSPLLSSLACFLSVVFWWPLFKLGQYHARKRRPTRDAENAEDPEP